MSKAYVTLNDNLVVPTQSSINTVDRGATTPDTNWRLIRIVMYGLIFVAVIGILIRWWKSDTEPFNPDYPGSRDSFPARIDSNTMMNRAGLCNTPFRTGRSILKPYKKGVGYVRPFNDKSFNHTVEERERERRKFRVRWSDPLVEVMGHE